MKKIVIMLAFALSSGLELGAANPTDLDLRSEIEKRFLRDDSVVASDLKVAVTNGVATLRGQVSNLLLRDRAERIAESVPTLHAVFNRIEVMPFHGTADRRIRNDLRLALALDPVVELPELKVSVVGGTVALSGVVQSQLEREFAVRAAKSIRGVLAVKDLILVKPEMSRPDDEIRVELQRALDHDVWLLGDHVHVKVENGHVKLNGAVTTLAERRRALNRCWTAGVKSVDASMIDVWKKGEPLPRREVPRVTDDEIRHDIKVALIKNSYLLSTRVDVEVKQGVVDLSGQVRSLRAVREAEREAYGVTGVRRVRNGLKVALDDPRSDQQLREAVEVALEREAALTGEDNISVSVVGGAALLKGTTATAFARAHAEQVVSGVPGILNVVNRLKTTGPSAGFEPLAWDSEYQLRSHYEGIPTMRGVAERDLREAIKNELRVSPFVNAGDIDVSVNAHTATLTGSVPNWHQRRLAGEVARRAGVTTILNRLQVRPAVD